MSKDKRGFGERSSNRPQAAQEASPPPRREHETYEVSIEGKGRWGCIHVAEGFHRLGSDRCLSTSPSANRRCFFMAYASRFPGRPGRRGSSNFRKAHEIENALSD